MSADTLSAKLLEAAKGLIDDTTAHRIKRTLHLMGIAEVELAEAKKRWPRKATKIHVAFMLLNPGDLVLAGDALYESHAREILRRVVMNEDVRPGTDAECCFVLMQATLAAPPIASYAMAYGRLFARVFPEQAEHTHDLGRENIPGEVDEIIARLRRKIGEHVKRDQRKTPLVDTGQLR